MDPATDPDRDDSPGRPPLWREILLRLPAAVAYVTGPDLVIEFANDECRRIAGRRDLVGLPLRDALPELAPEHLQLVEHAAQSGQPVHDPWSEIWARQPGDGLEPVLMDFIYQPVPDDNLGAAGVLLYGSEVTAHGHARPHREHRTGVRDRAARPIPEQAARRARQRLAFLQQVREHTTRVTQLEQRRRELEAELHQAERLQTVGQLTSGIAHDFGNLLAVIIGYADMAEDVIRDSSDPELRRIVGEIRSVADRAVHLSGDLVRIGHRGRPRPAQIELNTLITRMTDLLAVCVSGRADIVFELSPTPLPLVLADWNQLEQVLINLAVNARNAMPEGGTLTISTTTADFGEERSGRHPGTKPGRYVELTVRDTGVGMSPEVQEKIFERFYTSKPGPAGAGIGLFTVRGTVTDLGGAIEVDSAEGQGSTFRIYLPARPLPPGVRCTVTVGAARVGRQHYPVVRRAMTTRAKI